MIFILYSRSIRFREYDLRQKLCGLGAYAFGIVYEHAQR